MDYRHGQNIVAKKTRVSYVNIFLDVTVTEDDRVDLVRPQDNTPHPSGLMDLFEPYPSTGVWLGRKRVEDKLSIVPRFNVKSRKPASAKRGRKVQISDDEITVTTKLLFTEDADINLLLEGPGVKNVMSRKGGGSDEPDYHSCLIIIQNMFASEAGYTHEYLDCWLIYNGYLDPTPYEVGGRELDEPLSFVFHGLASSDPESENPDCLRDIGTQSHHHWYEDIYTGNLVNPNLVRKFIGDSSS
jgi:hypothetical protein